jgi:hypothetical protein
MDLDGAFQITRNSAQASGEMLCRSALISHTQSTNRKSMKKGGKRQRKSKFEPSSVIVFGRAHHESRRRVCLQYGEVLDRPKLDLPNLTFVWRWLLSSSWFRKVSPQPAQIRNRGLTSSPSPVLNSSRLCFHSDI